VRMQDVGRSHGIFLPVFKEQRFACRSAGAKGIYRILYSMDKDSLLLIEIYNKGSQENPDIDLIKKSMKGLKESHDLSDSWVEIKGGSCRNLYINDNPNDE